MNVNTREGTVKVIDDQISAVDIIREMAADPAREEPFYVVNLSDVVFKHKMWKLNLPRVEPFYAVKCNDTTTVLEVLAALGTGFDCASKGEIQKVMDLGVDQSRIIYANPCKTMSFIKYAACRGVSLMTFDNEQELHKIKAIYPSAELVIRIRIDGKARCPLGIKFGVVPSQAVELLKVARELDLNVIGVSFHVGSGSEDANTYYRAIKASKELFDFASEFGYSFSLLDIGGGFPGQTNAALAFTDVVKVINTSLDEFFPETCGVRIIAEPGRYYVASAFTLCTNIIAKRSVSPTDDISTSEDLLHDSMHMYYVNDGVYGSFNCLLFDHAEVVALPLKEARWQTVGRCSIWGPTCDSMDRIIEECFLPLQDVGDWLVFENMGAYTVAAASSFNGFTKPALHFVASHSTWLYLQSLLRMSSADVVQCMDIPPMKAGMDICEETVPENVLVAQEVNS